MRKAQPALEFLTIYAWTLIAVLLFIVFALAISTSPSSQIVPPSHCYITPSFPCYAMFMMSNSIGTTSQVIFTNNLGREIAFSGNSLTVYPTSANQVYYGQCLPANALPNQVISCSAAFPDLFASIGQSFTPDFSISYSICSKSCTFPLPLYNTSGSAQLSVSKYVPDFRNFVELASPSSFGSVSPGNNTYNFGSKITISETPVQGHTFLGWTCEGQGCYSGSSASNTITVNNFIVETANFK